jgi:Asp-tRNA(Asn)/Glu-tRNA(Gln) amidotransferase A subunit family amidase
MDRIQFMKHRGKEILIFDLSGASAQEVSDAATRARDIITQKPRASMLVLADYTGAHIDRDAAIALKEAAAYDRPHVKRSAIVGAESLPKEYYDAIKRFSQREFPVFQTREQALEWLTKD